MTEPKVPGTTGSEQGRAQQFILTQRPRPWPAGWLTQQHAGWWLCTHPQLLVTPIETSAHGLIGWALGNLLDPAGEQPAPDRLLLSEPGPAAFAAMLETYTGRYCAIQLDGPTQRLYLDGGGGLPAVYSAATATIASSPSWFAEPEHPADDELIAALQMPASGLWYPFGLTPRRGVQRLLPNHYLDLHTWTAVRHWPQPADVQPAEEPAPLLATIAQITSGTIVSAARLGPPVISLTAGRDSRMVLACSRPVAPAATYFTFALRRPTSDTHIAARLARQAGLRHRAIPFVEASPTERAVWLDRTGHCVSGAIWRTHPTLFQLPQRSVSISGVAGEVGRAYYWRAADHPELTLTASALLDRLHLPDTPQLRAAAERWLADLPSVPLPTVLDLAYIELRLGCWAAPQPHGTDHWFAAQIAPLAQRQVFAAMLRLPVAYRRTQRLPVDLCALRWPELLGLPFNEFSGAARYPMLALKYLRRTVVDLGARLSALRHPAQ